jgi:hypothetical protein
MVSDVECSAVTRREDGRYVKPCPSCGAEQDYLRRNYAVLSYLSGKVCKACSNKVTKNCGRGFHEAIRISWFEKFRIGAETRGLEWCLSIEDVWDTYIRQGGVCALSGLPIGWSEVGQVHTASIDRIDSDIGYRLDNIQLLHKDVNMMKQAFSHDYFVTMCWLIANNTDEEADKVKW